MKISKSSLFISKIAPDNINPSKEVCFKISFFHELFDEFCVTIIYPYIELTSTSWVTVEFKLFSYKVIEVDFYPWKQYKNIDELNCYPWVETQVNSSQEQIVVTLGAEIANSTFLIITKRIKKKLR